MVQLAERIDPVADGGWPTDMIAIDICDLSLSLSKGLCVIRQTISLPLSFTLFVVGAKSGMDGGGESLCVVD